MVLETEDRNKGWVWGPYPNYDDIARFQYGRMMWRVPEMRQRLLKHWTDERHPYRERFLVRPALLEQILSSTETEQELDEMLKQQGSSLRCMTSEIPLVF